MSITVHSADFRTRIDRLLIQIPEYRKVVPVVSGMLNFGTGNSAQGIRNPTNDWNPERVRNPVPEIL